MDGDVQRALREVRETLLSNPVSPRVETPREINLHYCRYVAKTVVERVDDDSELVILEDGGHGYVHTWLWYDGCHYDAECLDGVADHRDLPFFKRHPEAALGIAPESTDPATLRYRGSESLYPAELAGESTADQTALDWRAYHKYGIAGILIGSSLIAIGMAGAWAVHSHLADLPAVMGILFSELELLGELLVMISPVIFYLLLPAQRRGSQRGS